MAIETTEAGYIFTGDDIRYFVLCSRKGALKLECLGMKRRGQSAYSICKQVYGFRGTKQRVLEQMEQLIDDLINRVKSVDDLPAQ